jgi:predicted nucleic acid-binding Zn ribbon protein
MADPIEHSAVVESRIAHIAALMRKLQWRRGETGRILALKWGLSEDRVKHLAAEASHRVRAEVLDRDTVQETVACALDKVLRANLNKKGSRAARTVIQAAKTWAVITGAVAPKKIEHSGSITTNYDDVLGDIARLADSGGSNADSGAVGTAGPATPADDRKGGC